MSPVYSNIFRKYSCVPTQGKYVLLNYMFLILQTDRFDDMFWAQLVLFIYLYIYAIFPVLDRHSIVIGSPVIRYDADPTKET